MKTPIVDFVKRYAESGTARFHMPGHKGVPRLGCEALDITEIHGADVLYDADGIINESEEFTSSLFHSAHTFFSTEGSSLCIKAMLALVKETAENGERVRILAARNAHKAFIYAAALLDFDVVWLTPAKQSHLCSCPVSADDVRRALLAQTETVHAVYLTSPDYLGQIQDVYGISSVCRAMGLPLLVDNAHGAYLAFSEPNQHPLALGADLCCDSAHKTLPVLTGGAYLHVSANAPASFLENARGALALFASTSPSYLILQSLDLANSYLADGYREKLSLCIGKGETVKTALRENGIAVEESEPLKLVLNTHPLGMTGEEVACLLREKGVEIEFADDRFAVMMFTPENTDGELSALLSALLSLPRRTPIRVPVPRLSLGETVCSVREAILSPSESVDVENAEGRVCAAPLVSCPPAVPIVMSGERITAEAVAALRYYGKDRVRVMKS